MPKMPCFRLWLCLTILSFLSLTSIAQNIKETPKLLGFPNTTIGTTSAPLTVTLNNNQTGTLTISGMQISAPYSQTNNCGSTVAPNASCTISVKFSPTAVKYYSSTLTIT